MDGESVEIKQSRPNKTSRKGHDVALCTDPLFKHLQSPAHGHA